MTEIESEKTMLRTMILVAGALAVAGAIVAVCFLAGCRMTTVYMMGDRNPVTTEQGKTTEVGRELAKGAKTALK